MAAVARSGCSTVARWAAPGITTSWEPAMPWWMASAISSGVAGSSAPQITRVGAVIVWIWSRRSMPPMAVQHPAYPSSGVSTSPWTRGSTMCGARPRCPAANHRGVMASTSAAVPFRPHQVRPLQPPLGRAQVGRRAAQHQRGDALGGVDAQPHADHAAERQAAVGDPLDLQPVEQGQHVADRGRPGSTGRAARASRRGRGGRSARRGSGGTAPGPAEPTSRRRSRWSCRARPPARRPARPPGSRARPVRSSWCCSCARACAARARSMNVARWRRGGRGVERVEPVRRHRARLARSGRRPAPPPAPASRRGPRGRRPPPRGRAVGGLHPGGDERADDGLGHDQPAGQVEVGPHPRRVDRRGRPAGPPTARPRRR